MTRKVITITTRYPRNRTERKIYGETNSDGNVVDIFISTPANRKNTDLLDTVYHELTHAIVKLYKTKLSGRREERLCRAIGKAAVEAFTNA